MSARDPGPALVAAIVASAAAVGCTADVQAIATRDWASATFVGHRHRVTLDLVGEDVDMWLAGLAETEWLLPGHLIAEVEPALREPCGRVVLRVLTLRDAPPYGS